MATKTKSRLHGRPRTVTLRAKPRPIEREAEPERAANPLFALHQAVGNQIVRRMVQYRRLPPGAVIDGHTRLGNQTIQRLLTASPPAAQHDITARQVPSLLQRNGEQTDDDSEDDSPISGLYTGEVVKTWQPGFQVGVFPVMIFDMTRGPMDVVSLWPPPSSHRTREEAPPNRNDEEQFSAEELRELEEEQEMRRAPERYERVAAELDEAYEAIDPVLSQLFQAAKPWKLDLSDLAERDKELERKLKRRPYDVYLKRQTIRAEIESLKRDADHRLQLVNALGTFSQYVEAIRRNLDDADKMLTNNEQTLYRRQHLRDLGTYKERFGPFERVVGDVIQRYREMNALGFLNRKIRDLEKISEEVGEFHELVQEHAKQRSGASKSQAQGSANTLSANSVVFEGDYGKLTKSVYEQLDAKLLPDSKLKELLSTFASETGTQGIKKLATAIEGGFTHELKFLGKLGGTRAYGKVDPRDGKVLFTKLAKHL